MKKFKKSYKEKEKNEKKEIQKISKQEKKKIKKEKKEVKKLFSLKTIQTATKKRDEKLGIFVKNIDNIAQNSKTPITKDNFVSLSKTLQHCYETKLSTHASFVVLYFPVAAIAAFVFIINHDKDYYMNLFFYIIIAISKLFNLNTDITTSIITVITVIIMAIYLRLIDYVKNYKLTYFQYEDYLYYKEKYR